VHPQQLVAPRVPTLERHQGVVYPCGADPGSYCVQARRALRVTPAGIVPGKARILGHQEHRAEGTSGPPRLRSHAVVERIIGNGARRRTRVAVFGDRAPGPASRTWNDRPWRRSLGWARIGSWRGRDDVSYLALTEDARPDGPAVQDCLERLRRRGFTTVVTNAVGPAVATALVDGGFEVRERLRLLERRFPAPLRGRSPAVPPGSRLRQANRRAGSRDWSDVLALDARAFDGFWRLDPESGLGEALRATPAARFRVGTDAGRATVAYAITGRAARRGYLQRIAVHPQSRRQGWGRVLVHDALHWLERTGAHQALVNTQWENDAAHALYESCGFRELPAGLCVLGRAL